MMFKILYIKFRDRKFRRSHQTNVLNRGTQPVDSENMTNNLRYLKKAVRYHAGLYDFLIKKSVYGLSIGTKIGDLE